MGIKMNNTDNMFLKLQAQIEEAQKLKKPIDGYVKQQIDLLKNAHDEFVKTVQDQGFDLNTPQVGEIEIKQYSAMKQLAQKIGLPVKEYDECIKAIQIRIFGKENYERFFGKGAE